MRLTKNVLIHDSMTLKLSGSMLNQRIVTEVRVYERASARRVMACYKDGGLRVAEVRLRDEAESVEVYLDRGCKA
jgi:hypothetical protein